MKRYRKKTELEIALSPIISRLGRMPTPKEVGRYLGGDLSHWGRILKGQQKIRGEYHARLKLLKEGVDNAQFKLQAAEKNKKYGERTRKGRLVPHTDHIFYDLYEFNKNKIIMSKMEDHYFEDAYDAFLFYREQEIDIYNEGGEFPKTYFEEQTIRRDFLNDLNLSS